jgi:DNA-binding transcriptional LysR family regulator
MDVRQMRGLVEVADAGSISRAAANLYVTPSALMQQIKNLEREIGAPVLTRTPKGSSLTPVGQLLCRSFRTILAEIDSTVEDAQEFIQGGTETLRVGLPPIPLESTLEQAYRQFSAGSPRVAIQWVATTYRQSYEFIRNGDLDVIGQPYALEREQRGIAFTPLYDCPFAILVDSNDELASRKSVTPDDLAGRTIATFDAEMAEGVSAYLANRRPDIKQLKLTEPTDDSTAEMEKLRLEGVSYLTTMGVAHNFPKFTGVRFDVPVTCTFGLVHATNPTDVCARFLEFAQAFYAALPADQEDAADAAGGIGQ